MTEEEARGWIATRWGTDSVAKLALYVDLIRTEARNQNLIAQSTMETIWSRHIVDSAQLVPLAGTAGEDERWLDIGSGAGLPGVVAAILQPRQVILVEPRRKRTDFLSQVVTALSLDAIVLTRKVASVDPLNAAVISARAVASLDDLFEQALSHCGAGTVWLLPKGQSAESELMIAKERWTGMFHVEQSLTAEASKVVVARKVKRK